MKNTMTERERKKEKACLTEQIKILIAKKRALCLGDKAKKQETFPTYARLCGSPMVLLRFEAGMIPTTSALNAGITLIAHHYKELKHTYGYIEKVDPPEEDHANSAFLGEICPATNKRWYKNWELWTWGESALVFHSGAILETDCN